MYETGENRAANNTRVMGSSRGLPRCATVTVMILLPVLVLLSHLNSVVVVQQQQEQYSSADTGNQSIVEYTRDTDIVILDTYPVPTLIDGSMEPLAVDSIITELPGHVNNAVSRNALGNVSQQVGNTSNVPSSNVSLSSSIMTAPLKLPKVAICKRTLPTAIVVGIQKCGTTALGKFLDLHPQVQHARGEVKYFTSHYGLGLDWYKSRLPCAMPGQIVTEKSPGYFYREESVRRIYDMKEGIKLILIVKDPIVRAQSHYAMGHGASASGFQEGVLKSNGEIDPQSYVIDYSIYSMYMKPWLDVFPLDRICFIDGHNLEQHPEVEMKRVETFLNISSFFRSTKFVLNTPKGKPCFYKRGRKHCFSKSKGRKHPPVTPILQKKLQEFFHPLNEKFFSMINRRFEWGY